MIHLIRRFIFNQKIEYLFWGGMTTLVYFVARLLTMLVTTNVFIPVLIAQIISIIFAFYVNKDLVFNDHQKQNNLKKQATIFVLGRCIGILLDFLLSYLMIKRWASISINILHLDQFNYHWILFSSRLARHFIGNPISLNTVIWIILIQVIIIVINYIVSKFWAFK